MKKFLQKSLYLTVVLCLVLSSVVTTSFASSKTTYSTEANSGTRDEVCTTLEDTSAADYYTGQYTYDNLSTLSESQLLSSLRKLMTDTHSTITSYNNCRDFAHLTDCENESENIVTIYTSYSTSHSEYNSGQGWNREHVWPQSLGGFGTSGGGSDLHHIRPSESKTNSTRGNSKYGEVSGGKNATGNLSGDIGGTYANDIFEPLDNVKGDVARICLYVYVRWGGTSGYTCNNLTNVFCNIETLLEWCALDPVDTWEMGRNEVVAEIQGNRNVFIDYPELAWQLLGKEIPENMVTPSGEANEGSSGSGSTSCVHSTTSVVNKKDATCSEDGYTGDVKCEDCKQIVTKGSVIVAIGHSYGSSVVTKEPTENESGTAIKTCSKCGKTVTVVLKPTGEDSPIKIVSNNVYYKQTLNLMYAVSATEGYSVVVKIYDDDENLIEIITDYKVEEVNGEMLKTFTSNIGVPAKDIDTEFFAVAELLDGGRVVATSSAERYSVLEYLYERLTVSVDVTDAQRSMYKRLLAYANSADVVVDDVSSENSIGNYSYVRVEDGSIDGMYDTAMIKSGSVLNNLIAFDYVVENGEILSWTIVRYNFEQSPYTFVLTDEMVKNGELDIESGMSYILTPNTSDDEPSGTVPTTPKSYSYTFTSKQFSANGTKELGGVDWTLAGNGGYWGTDSTKGQQFGSGNNPYKSMTLTSEAFSHVSKIVINTSGAKDINGKLNVYVDGTLVGTVTLTSVATEYTIDVSDISGEIKLEYTQTSSKALYIKSIAVDYAE